MWGGVGSQEVQCQKRWVSVVLPEVRLQGRKEFGRQLTHCVERIVQGPLVRVP